MCVYTWVKPALKYSSIGLIKSSIEVIISTDFLNSSSDTSSFAVFSNILGSFISLSKALSICEVLQNSQDLKALS